MDRTLCVAALLAVTGFLGSACDRPSPNPSFCGDGTVDVNELCDDGNQIETDGCTTRCAPPTCGDAILQAPEACDDGNVSDEDACLSSCVAADCGDGFVWSGVEACDPASASPPATCNADCTLSVCGDGVIGASEECDDGDVASGDGCDPACTVTPGFCCIKDTGCVPTGTEPPGDPCRVCDPGASTTEWTPQAGGCTDGLYCNGTDTCSGGACSLHAGSPCGGGTPYCNEDTDACFACISAADCNDGNVCTTDACTGGACSHVANTASCSDNLFCNGTDTCSAGTCSIHAGTPCAGATPVCNESADACVGCLSAADCNDGNACTTDACASGTCSHVANTASCTDGLWCNGTDTCSGGTCSIHTGSPCAGATPYCNESTDFCFACLSVADCNDGNVCTTDACTSGACSHVNNAVACNDNLFCNGTDTCSGGTCSVHSGTPCNSAQVCVESADICGQCLTAGDCDDGESCTAESCVNYTCKWTIVGICP